MSTNEMTVNCDEEKRADLQIRIKGDGEGSGKAAELNEESTDSRRLGGPFSALTCLCANLTDLKRLSFTIPLNPAINSSVPHLLLLPTSITASWQRSETHHPTFHYSNVRRWFSMIFFFANPLDLATIHQLLYQARNERPIS